MAGSGGIGQLLKGLIMGIVLILAIIGTMSMLDKKGDDSPVISQSTEITAPTTPEIKAPDINIASQTPVTETSPKVTEKTPDEENTQADTFQPTLEGEKTAEDRAKELEQEKEAARKAEEDAKPKYGLLKLSTINPENNDSLSADYVVFDNKNKKIAESNNVNTTSYKLLEGTYKVVTTLTQSNEDASSNVEPVQSTQTITITADNTTAEVFELEPPSTIGVLQVSAINSKNQQSLKASFIIQKESGETVASRQNVTRSLFKLKAGSYKVTVKSGNNSDFRTIVVKGGESLAEIFKLKEAASQGKVLVRVYDMNSNKPVAANISISASDGKMVQELKAVSQTEIALSAGTYQVSVVGPNGKHSKNITVIAGKSSNEVFRIDAPNKPTNEVQITDNVKISGIERNTEKIEPTTPEDNANTTDKATIEIEPVLNPTLGSLKLFARNAIDQRPLKSNFYIQTPNGKNIDKKIYSDSAVFKLKPGRYKVTIRSKNRKNIVSNVDVIANRVITKGFQLQKNLPANTKTASTNRPTTKNNNSGNTQTRQSNNTQRVNTPILAPAKPSTDPRAIPNGFLNVSMQPAKKTHFIIANRAGKKIVELTSVPSGKFKLDTGVYIVTAILNGERRKKTIQVNRGKTTRLSFKQSDFRNQTSQRQKPQANLRKGVLRSRIVDNAGRPIKGNLTVTNRRGQVVARANSVTVGVFNLPPVPHTVIVNYRGLSGSEKVSITAGQTTVQTFTISPNNNRPTQRQAAPARTQQRDPKDALRDKLQEELRRVF